ncbi:MAG: DUF5106 domain-containing protein [Bacteroidales bacterium]|nr:DUF5106 domain-containing protein [Bacteroidales bacterium]
MAVESAFAQPKNHHIEIEMRGWQDTTIILSYHYAGRNYVKDTLFVYNEIVTIQGDSSLHPGMYAIIAGQNRLLDFFVDENDQNFSFKTIRTAIIDSLIVENSRNNENFFEWIKFLAENGKKRDSLDEVLSKAVESKKKKAKKAAVLQLENLTRTVQEKRLELFFSDPELLVSRFMKAQEEVIIPCKNDKESDQRQDYLYFKRHYFDNWSLSDDALLYTPIYEQKMDWYFKNLVPLDPDSLINEGNILIEKAKGNVETYRYVIWKTTNFAESSPIMGMERAFVHFIDNYYFPDTSLTSSAMRSRMIKRADELRRSMVGVKASNLVIQDSSFQLQALSNINADFVIIYFFDPDCGHCKTETDSLLSFYRDYKAQYNFEIYAVCSDTSMTKMKTYIQNYNIPWIVVNGPRTLHQGYWELYDVPSMPTIYLIDREKTILTKRLDAHNTFQFLKIYAMQKNKEK